jgi:hypothetical protein
MCGRSKDKTYSHPQCSIGLLVWIEDDSQLPELERCLDSLKDFNVIVINGKWIDIAGNKPISTDRTIDLINSYNNVTHIYSVNNTEAHNRNLALSVANKMNREVLFWVDTDEYVELPCGYEFFLRGLEFGDKYTCYSHYEDKGRGGSCRMIRGIRDVKNVTLTNRHNEWIRDGTNIYKDSYQAPRGLIIYSDRKYRSEERQAKMLNRNKNNPIH